MPLILLFFFVFVVVPWPFLNEACATTLKTPQPSLPILRPENDLRSAQKHTWGSSRISKSVDTESFDSLVSQWLNKLEQSSQPMQSPSESPIPEGVGESPKYRGVVTSIEGINQAAYKDFVLNQRFYTEREEEPSIDAYKRYELLLNFMEKKAEVGSLSLLDRDLWQGVANVIIKSYQLEHGAVFFDVAFRKCWKYCGWVNMSTTFVETNKAMRLCASLRSLGMEDIIRKPEEGKDFIIPGHSNTLQIQKLTTPVLRKQDQALAWKGAQSEEQHMYVDLYGYPDYCYYPSWVSPNCFSFCCMSPYYGCDFCMDCGYWY